MTALTIRRRSRSTASAPLLVRLVIWVLAAVVAVAGFTGLEGSTDSATGVDARTVFDASTGDVTGVYADHGGSQGELYAGLTGCDTRANYGDPTSSCGNPTPIELLPAWRWAGSLDLHTNINVGIRDAGNIGALMMSNLGAMAFAVASVIWSITLFLIRFAVTSDWLTPAGRAINSGFVHLSGALLGVVAVAWFVTLIRVGKLSLKANVPGMIRQIVTFAAPIAFMFYMSDQAAKDMDTSAGLETSFVESSTTIRAVGSPPWFAQKGTEYIDMIGSSFVHGFSLVNADGASLGMTGSAPVDPSCQDYVDTLYTQYHRYAPAEAQSAALEQASRLWMLGMYDPWSVAQFGSNRDRHRVACFVLEENNDTPVKERQRLFALTYDWAGTGGHESIWADGPADELRFPGKGSKEYRNRVFSWMACYYDNGWRHDPRWIGIQGSSSDTTIYKIDGLSSGEAKRQVEAGNRDFRAASGSSPYCAARFNEGWASRTLVQPGKTPVLGEIDANEVNEQTRKNGDARTARNRINTFFGKTGGSNRIVLGVIAIVTAGMYLFALGAVSLGAIISQFGLILLLMLLPIAFVAWSMGAKAGSKMIRMTIGLCASKLIFTLILTAIVQITVLGMTLINSSGVEATGAPQMAGFASTVATGLMPLIAFVALNKVMSSLGFGKLTSIGGALGMISNIAGQASKGGSVTDFAKGMGNGKAAKFAKSKFGDAKKSIGQGRELKKDIRRLQGRDALLARKIAAAPEGDAKDALQKRRDENLKALTRLEDKKEERKQDRQRSRLWAARAGLLAAAGLAVPGALPAALALAGAAAAPGPKELYGKAKDLAGNLGRNQDPALLNGDFSVPELGGAGDPALVAEQFGRDATILGAQTDGGRAVAAAHAVDATLKEAASITAGNTSGTAISDSQRLELKAKAAVSLGVDPDDVLIDHYGNAVLDPARLAGGRLMDVPVAMRGRPELHLDQDFVKDGIGLPEGDRATRITGALASLGHLQVTDGTVALTDVLAQAGIEANGRIIEEYARQMAEAGSSVHAALMPTVAFASGSLGADLRKGVTIAADQDSRELTEAMRAEMDRVRSSVMDARTNLEQVTASALGRADEAGALVDRLAHAEAARMAGTPTMGDQEIAQLRHEFALAAANLGAELRSAIPSRIQLDGVTQLLAQGPDAPAATEAGYDAALTEATQTLNQKLDELELSASPDQLRAFVEETIAELTGTVAELEQAVERAGELMPGTAYSAGVKRRPDRALAILKRGRG